MINQATMLRVRDIIDSPFAVAAEDGQLIYDAILQELRASRSVCLSFAGVTAMIAAFLNSAVGPLVTEFTQADLRRRLRVTGAAGNEEEMVNAVLRNARAYCANPEAYDAAWAEEMSGAV